MDKDELFSVLEALKAAYTELDALINDDVHYPSGRLMEQIEDAIEVAQEKYDNSESR
jgi:hypothetical protein